MSDDTEILREIRDLLRLMAEPALAKRDERLRTSLQQVIGKSKQKAEAVVLMDGTRSQTAIRADCGIDDGNLSRLVKALREAELIGPDDKHPKLVFPLPSNLPGTVGKGKE
jgi:DNA-binding transcriptional ArsR family regulator